MEHQKQVMGMNIPAMCSLALLSSGWGAKGKQIFKWGPCIVRVMQSGMVVPS